MTDPVGSIATLIVVAIIAIIAMGLYYAGGLWPFMFFVSATALQSDHE